MATRGRPTCTLVHESCSACAEVNTLRKVTLPCRDKDTLNCQHCGAELITWNGGVMYMHHDTEKKD